MKKLFLMLVTCFVCSAYAENFFDPVIREMEGFEIHIDPALLEDDEGRRIVKMLEARLMMIVTIMPEPALTKLRTCPIWIEKYHPTLGAMQFHPSVGWLRRNGHDPRLEKMVHIPRAKELLSRGQMAKHPWVVLHELAHAYHKRIIGHDHKGVNSAFAAAKASGKYEKVLLYNGREGVRHYGMSNPFEYFAESTEAYFAQNDFYPFVRAELRKFDPQMFGVMEEVWGKL